MNTNIDPKETVPKETVPNGTKKSKKKKRPRCQVCNKKLSLYISFECRCKKKFCPVHRYASEHNCTFDYKNEGRNQLIKDNPKIEPKKINLI